MLLNEFTDIELKATLDKFDRFQDGRSLINYLDENGFIKYGGGLYSEVYGKKGYNRLVKVKDSRVKGQSYYYYKYCKENRNKSKYFPKVYHLAGDDISYVAVVERLVHFNVKYVSNEELVILFKESKYSRDLFWEIKRRNLLMVPDITFDDIFGNPRPRDWKGEAINYIIDNMKVNYKDHPLSDVFKLLYKKFPRRLDIWTNNIMHRPRDKHVVLMDPVVQ